MVEMKEINSLFCKSLTRGRNRMTPRFLNSITFLFISYNICVSVITSSMIFFNENVINVVPHLKGLLIV